MPILMNLQMSNEINMFYKNFRGIGIWVSVISVIILSVSCSNNRKSDVVDGIIQFNQHGQYPLIDLKLSDIADVEYVKLKDSDSAFQSLLTGVEAQLPNFFDYKEASTPWKG